MTQSNNPGQRPLDLAAVDWLNVAAGAGLLILGSRFRGVFSAVAAATGGALLYRSFSLPRNEKIPPFARGVRLQSSIWVNASPADCYGAWRDLEKLSQFLDYLDSVTPVSERRSRWKTKAIGGYSLEWEAEIIKDVEGSLIGWRSLPGSDVKTSGSVAFVDDDGGTQVSLTMKYHLPAGIVGDALLGLLAESPERQAQRLLWRFKQTVEEGSAAKDEVEASRVDEALIESFPASDPPPWTP